jgi:NAD(P)-dependent dehydrogenase (short-subunit alcohol dehydrogenase family)
MSLSGKTAIVTGAASGIGLAIAIRLSREGASVIALDRKSSVSALAKRYPNVDGLLCDVADREELAVTLGGVLGSSAVDILVNNAGCNPSPSALIDTSDETWSQLVETNLSSLFRVSKLVLPHMKQGVVINIGSILGIVGARKNAAYAATKGAILSLTRAMARDHGPAIRVNSVCPGAVETEMFETYLQRCEDPEAERQRIVSAIPLQRLGTVDDIAAAVFFLISDQASWITGHALVVDGGDSI